MVRSRTFRRLVAATAGFALVAALTTSTPTAALSGSSFEGADGNLVVDGAGNADWANAPDLVVGTEAFTGKNDNSFGKGTKEDDPATTIVTGSIPPNKSDLSRFYVASDFANGSNYLYLAWQRTNTLGSANMDFELNRHPTPGFTTGATGPLTINRTEGDILITFDVGSGDPVLGLLTWIESGPTSRCFSSGKLPCWGDRVNLSSAGFAEGRVNQATVTDPINGNFTLPPGTFGEAAVNLSASGVFPSGACESLGSAFLKSRSSASFTADMKDFIAPVPVHISNCTTISVEKVTENGDGTFGFTTTGGLEPDAFTLSNGGVQEFDPVLPGTYTITESDLPENWTLADIECPAAVGDLTVDIDVDTATVTVDVEGIGGDVHCVFTNHTHFTPTLSTSLVTGGGQTGTAVSAAIGENVHDTATLTGAGPTAGGTVTYRVFTSPACDDAVPLAAGTVTVTNGVVPNSNTLSFANAGTYYWQADYSGDTSNLPATSPCTAEVLTVVQNQSAITTAQSFVPNDSATLSGLAAPGGGTLTFALFAPADATCAGAPAYNQVVTVAGNGTYATTNTTFVAATPGTWRWRVTYSGDANNVGSTSACGVENFTIVNG